MVQVLCYNNLRGAEISQSTIENHRRRKARNGMQRRRKAPEGRHMCRESLHGPDHALLYHTWRER